MPASPQPRFLNFRSGDGEMASAPALYGVERKPPIRVPCRTPSGGRTRSRGSLSGLVRSANTVFPPPNVFPVASLPDTLADKLERATVNSRQNPGKRQKFRVANLNFLLGSPKSSEYSEKEPSTLSGPLFASNPQPGRMTLPVRARVPVSTNMEFC